ncbi:GNAT family N-acetyltransferase [Massilia sp. PAMC28688]|uniref:GNAT family N-acetyltransferase n=1 Tax=Massilia sp. PAMC28688 TaxID=2861283 RepID=UPI001C628CA7|nr:GNAT family N-acetyltransferase [Massilia sp. PAMC28688]QYF95315.1 GNAT family N-acetyltransferase [Massilia sp. PAMC28688]
MKVGACDPDHPDAQLLLAELSAALEAITGSSGAASFAPDDVRGPGAAFALARDDDGRALGCGALRQLTGDIGEIKRMYARPGSGGAGAALLAYLEHTAHALGYSRLWLETRCVNTRAMAFYARHGYTRIANYGQYRGRPEAACFEKRIPGAR